MGYGKHTIRGLEVWSDKNDAELMEAAERWSEGKDHDAEELESLWDDLPPENQQVFLKSAAMGLGDEDPKKQPGDSNIEHRARREAADILRQKYIERDARSIFARTLLPTREEKLTKLLNTPASGETKVKLDSIESREQEAKDRADEARENREKQRRAEGY